MPRSSPSRPLSLASTSIITSVSSSVVSVSSSAKGRAEG